MKPLKPGLKRRYRNARGRLFGEFGLSYDPKKASARFASLLKKGEVAASLGHYGLYLCAKEEGEASQADELGKIALSRLEEARASGEAEVEFAYGSLLSSRRENPEEASRCFASAAEKGHPLALGNLAICYETGRGTVKDEGFAFACANRASSLGSGFADYVLYRYFRDGIGAVSDQKKAIAYLRRSCKRGCRKAMLTLSDLIRKGDVFEKDPKRKSLRLLKKAARLGYSPALVRLGYCYAEGLLGLHTQYTYVECFAKAKGSSVGKYALGLCFLEGAGLIQNEKGALALFEESAALGYRPAEYMVAKCYAHGIGTEKDEEKSFRHLKKFFSPEDDLNLHLGKCYAHGIIVREDLSKALDCFRAGISLGSEACREELLRLEGSGRVKTAVVVLEDAKRAEAENLIPLLVSLRGFTFKEALTAMTRAPITLFEDLPALEAEAFAARLSSLGATVTVSKRE